MKALALPFLCLALAAPALAEKAVPLDNFRLNMTFGEKTEKAHTYIHLSGELKAGEEKPELESREVVTTSRYRADEDGDGG